MSRARRPTPVSFGPGSPCAVLEVLLEERARPRGAVVRYYLRVTDGENEAQVGPLALRQLRVYRAVVLAAVERGVFLPYPTRARGLVRWWRALSRELECCATRRAYPGPGAAP